MALVKNYSEFHRVTFEGKSYIFDPYEFGVGSWKHLTSSGKAGLNVEKRLQLQLNNLIFSREYLPSLMERFELANRSEREKLKNISMTWLSLKIKGIKNQTNVPGSKPTTKFIPGGLYFYVYDAKLKETLPIWDMFPLTIPLEMYGDGFLGMNLHYLTEKERIAFISSMIEGYGRESGNLFNLSITYNIVNSLKGSASLKSSLKRYLYSHIRSRILPIETNEWAYAIWMQTQQFKYNKKLK